MINFFRKIRQNLLTENKLGIYLAYAIGEIVLVVIGILIALQINNWNENKKHKKRLDAIYTTVQQNLKTDLKNIKIPIKFFEALDSTLTKILTTTYSTSFLDSINETNHLQCIPCKSNINMSEPFEKQDNGFELLKKYEDNESIKGNEFSQDIIQFYTTQGKKLTTFSDVLIKESYSNLKHYEQFPWYSDYSIGKYNPDAIAYFLNDQNYKNKAANFKIIIGRNHLSNLKDYEAYAKDLIAKIEKKRQ